MSGPALGSRQPPAAPGWAEGLEGSRRGPGVLVTETERGPRLCPGGQERPRAPGQSLSLKVQICACMWHLGTWVSGELGSAD